MMAKIIIMIIFSQYLDHDYLTQFLIDYGNIMHLEIGFLAYILHLKGRFVTF